MNLIRELDMKKIVITVGNCLPGLKVFFSEGNNEEPIIECYNPNFEAVSTAFVEQSLM